MPETLDHNGNTPAATDIQKFPFTRLFLGFRYASAPGKILLALAGLALVFLAGHLLDAIWPEHYRLATSALPASGITNELEYFVSLPAFEEPVSAVERYRTAAPLANEQLLVDRLQAEPLKLSPADARAAIENNQALDRIRRAYKDHIHPASINLRQHYEQARENLRTQSSAQTDSAPFHQELQRRQEMLTDAYARVSHALIHGMGSETGAAERALGLLFQGNPANPAPAQLQAERAQITQAILLAGDLQLARAAQGQGIFATLYQFNVRQFHNIVRSVLAGNPGAIWESLKDIFQSWFWLARFHGLFAIIFTLACLAIGAIFGGAIARVVALQFARDERIGAGRALAFSLKKFGSFFAAPLIPLLIIAIVVLLILLGGLLGAIPYFGEIIAGLLLGLTFVGGFVIALVLIGWGVGLHLMYPTIAVEGSDSFDAISRSFAYLFARPWRLGFYAIVSAVYGAICYLFVRFFAFLLLWVSHAGLGAIMNHFSARYAAPGKLDALWPEPTFWELRPPFNWQILSGTETVGAFFMFLWVILIIGVVMAFVLNFYFSSTTIIYFLLRHRVDATDLEDIYVEQDIATLAAPAPETAAPAAPAPAPPAPESQGNPNPPPSQT